MKFAKPNADQMDNSADSRLACQAHNCPRNWSVDGPSGRLCSEHAWADVMDWGAITARIVSGQLMARAKRYEEPPAPMTDEQKRRTILRFKDIMGNANKDPRGWAKRLQQKEAEGKPLSAIQKKAWREALRVTA